MPLTHDALVAQTLADPDVPETVRQALLRGAKLESIRLDARGRWWHQGEMFENERLIALFSRSVHATPKGTWLVTIGQYSYPVEVEDVAVHVHRLSPRASQPGWIAHCTSGRSEPVLPEAVCTDGDSWLGVTLSDGRLARCIGAAHAALAAQLDVDETAVTATNAGASQWVIEHRGVRIPLRDRAAIR